MVDFTNVLVLVQKELRDARHNRWYLLYTAAFAALALALAWLGLSGVGTYGFAGFGRTGASLVNLVMLIVPLMGLTVGAMSLVGERERGSLLYLMAQPITQLEVLLGKYFGAALALMAALTMGFGLSGLVIGWQGGIKGAGTYLLLVVFSYFLALVSLSLGFLISSAVKKSSTAIGIALFLWLALVFFGDLGLMGTAIVLKMKVGELFSVAMLNPLQTFKMAAVLNIRNSLEALGPAGTYALRTYGERLLPLLVAVLGGWIALPLGLTYVIFKKKGSLA